MITWFRLFLTRNSLLHGLYGIVFFFLLCLVDDLPNGNWINFQETFETFAVFLSYLVNRVDDALEDGPLV